MKKDAEKGVSDEDRSRDIPRPADALQEAFGCLLQHAPAEALRARLDAMLPARTGEPSAD